MLKQKPAACVGRPASKSSDHHHQRSVDREVSSNSKPHPPNFPPAAEPCPAPDVTGESDFHFFIRRPGLNVRFRLPFENEEFAAGVIAPGRIAFVRILIERDEAGMPMRRARRLLHFCSGGTA